MEAGYSRMFGIVGKKNSTDFISVDAHECTACGDCVTACSQNVLAVKGPYFHRHIHIENRGSCIGCMGCVKICKKNVFKGKL